jgi:outer membrane biosynthesis protein TonB
LHLLFFLLYNFFGSLQLFPVNIEELLNKPNDQEKRMVFELVETPESARSQTPPENAELVSDKNAIARDQYQNKDKPAGNPYSEGDFDVKNLPIVPMVPTPPTERAAEQKTENSNNNQLTESSSQRTEYQKFSREELMKKNPSAADYQEQSRPDRPLYENRQFSAEDLGGFSFNTYDWDFAPYMLEMKRKVERHVFPPPAFTRMGLISGETLLRFKVMPNGEVKDLVVLKYTGHESLKETSVNAIKNSSRFKPLPADFPKDYLEVTAAFTYYVKR